MSLISATAGAIYCISINDAPRAELAESRLGSERHVAVDLLSTGRMSPAALFRSPPSPTRRRPRLASSRVCLRATITAASSATR
jgi:hypothetical protein